MCRRLPPPLPPPPSPAAGLYVYGYDAGLNVKNSFPVFSTHIEANYVKRKEDLYSLSALTDEERSKIMELSRDPRIGEYGGRRVSGYVGHG